MALGGPGRGRRPAFALPGRDAEVADVYESQFAGRTSGVDATARAPPVLPAGLHAPAMAARYAHRRRLCVFVLGCRNHHVSAAADPAPSRPPPLQGTRLRGL